MIKAKFIGRKSCGFEPGNIYELKTTCRDIHVRFSTAGKTKPLSCLCVYDKHSNAWCPYTSLEQFLKNWELIRKDKKTCNK